MNIPHRTVAAPGGVDAADAWLTPAEAAFYLRMSPSTLAKLRLSGAGPAYVKPSRAVRYLRSDLDSWALSRRHRATCEYVNRTEAA